MQSNPSKFQQGFESLRPVESISWHDAQMFCAQLNQRGDTHHFGLDGHWRLPTLDEWAYAALSGKNQTTWHFGDIEKDLDNYGWHAGNSGAQTKQVGMKKPNDWGFFDMHGLVGEWCENQVKESENVGERRILVYMNLNPQSPLLLDGCIQTKKSDGVGLRLVWSPV